MNFGLTTVKDALVLPFKSKFTEIVEVNLMESIQEIKLGIISVKKLDGE
jgi:hypothetical protein